jgi:hypothetical protein
MSGSWPSRDFPNLKETDYRKTSDATPQYNCLSWAADESHRRWEPDAMAQLYWPSEAPRELTIESFVAAYATRGYEVCESVDAEEGFEKIALYADSDGLPTHAAKQLPNGHWTSKLGDFEDIEHFTLECLNGDLYGTPTLYMRRNVTNR